MMHIHRLRPFAFALLVWFACAACGSDEDETATTIDWSALDAAIDPCTDFYRHACGNWQRTHSLPSSSPAVRRFDDAARALAPLLRTIIEQDAAGARAADDPDADRIGDFYNSCLGAEHDTRLRSEVKSRLTTLLSAKSLAELATQLAAQRLIGSAAFFGASIMPEPMDPTHYALVLSERGIELPNREDYLDETRADRRAAYKRHIQDLASLYGYATFDADSAISIETALAKVFPEPSERRDPATRYHPLHVSELEALAPMFPWQAHFAALGFARIDRVVVTNLDYFRALETLFETTPLPALLAYTAWQLMQDEASWLDSAVLSKDFEFWSMFSGALDQPSRISTCYSSTLRALGFAVAQPYLARHVAPGTVAAVGELSATIHAAMAQRLEAATWLDDATRENARAKLEAARDLIGFPKNWPSYRDVRSDRHSYVSNHFELSTAGWRKGIAKFDQAVDPDQWEVAPLTVNAYYLPTRNGIQIPAAVLRLPFFAVDGSAAGNYGAMGTILGHELTHAFDDQGRGFDGSGALRDWWTPAATQAFGERSQCLVDQFSKYTSAPGAMVDGKLTLGENIADLGGLRLAHAALSKHSEHEPVRHGHDERQQFFLAYAQLYCENARDAWLSQNVMTDTHTPSAERVNGTLLNTPEFAAAFHCGGPAPRKAVPEAFEMCQVW